jgi:hypothetical protein
LTFDVLSDELPLARNFAEFGRFLFILVIFVDLISFPFVVMDDTSDDLSSE